MPADIFPEINIPVVTVIWSYTGLSTPEMEQQVTTYSQYSISTNVTGVKNMEAQTLNGISVVEGLFPARRQPRPRYLADRLSGRVGPLRATCWHPAADHSEVRRLDCSGAAAQPRV